MTGKRLAAFEELILLTVASLDDAAYGVTVQERLAAETATRVSLGAVYAVLERLERKGLVRSSMGGATAERGGRRKRLFKTTAPGLAALREMQRIRTGLMAPAPKPRLA